MAKYNYNKKVLKGLSVGPFLHEVKTRNEFIEKASSELPNPTYNANILGAKLHPIVQYGIIVKVIEAKDAKTFLIAPNKGKGCNELAYFRAGQYISVDLNINGATLSKPYTLSSGPKDALGENDNTYSITVKATKDGYASKYILENWAEGTEISLSGPLGDFYYMSLRDAKDVVALAGGSGITPFLSMANAIAAGIEDFNLTIIYGSRTADNILLKDELDSAVKKANGKVKVVHVLSEEKVEGFENGFINAEVVKKYAPKGDYSVFVCGPKAMYNFVEGVIKELGLPKRRARFELSGEYGEPSQDPKYPQEVLEKEFKIGVTIHGERTEITCKAKQTIMSAIEAAGIKIPSKCRSGACGWCHSRLVSGDVFIPEKVDGRRAADKKFNWVHPCVTYPLSNVEIEVFPIV